MRRIYTSTNLSVLDRILYLLRPECLVVNAQVNVFLLARRECAMSGITTGYSQQEESPVDQRCRVVEITLSF